METTVTMSRTLYNSFLSKTQQKSGYSDKEREEICKGIQKEWGLLYLVERVVCY